MHVYVPINIDNHICESFKAVLPEGSLHKIEFHEIDKAKLLNEYIINKEKHTELRKISKGLAKQIQDSIEA